MKPDLNKRYRIIATYMLLVCLVGIVCVFLLWNIKGVSSVFSKIWSVFTPIIYGALIAYLLNPILRFFENKVFRQRNTKKATSRIARRIFCVSATIFLFFIIIALFVWMLLPQLTKSITDLGEKFPDYLEQGEQLASDIAQKDGIFSDVINALLVKLNGIIDNSYEILQKELLPTLKETLQSVALSALDVFLGVIFAIYFLFAKEHLAALVKKILRSLCSETVYSNILRIAVLADNIFGKYFSGVILDSTIVGLICFVFMSIVKMPYSPLISVIIGFTNIIPFFGPFIGAIPSLIILFVANPIYAVYFGIMILVLQQIDGNIIAPRIQSNATGLDPVWVIIAITLMSGLLGFAGMVLGVPLFSVLYVLIKESAEARLKQKNLPTETVHYMSEMGRAYCEKPEKEAKSFKEAASHFFKTTSLKAKNTKKDMTASPDHITHQNKKKKTHTSRKNRKKNQTKQK